MQSEGLRSRFPDAIPQRDAQPPDAVFAGEISEITTGIQLRTAGHYWKIAEEAAKEKEEAEKRAGFARRDGSGHARPAVGGR